MEVNETKKKSSLLFMAVVFVLAYILYFSFGFYHISNFVTADNHFWVGKRINQYWDAMLQQKWEKTRINDKPGVTLAIISGTKYLEEKVSQLPWAKNYFPQQKTADRIEKKQKLLAGYRLPIVVFNGIFCLYFFWIIKKITQNRWIALWSFVLILLSPVLLGISQIINPDSLLWTFTTAAILSYLALLKCRKKKFTVLTALFLGLSLLSKYTAAILYPFLFVAGVIYCIVNIEKWKEEKNPVSRIILKISFSNLLIVAGSMLVFALLMPASILKTEYLIKGTVGYPPMASIILAVLAVQFLLIIDAAVFKSKAFIFLFADLLRDFKNVLKLIPLILIIIFSVSIINWNADCHIFNPDSVIVTAHELEFAKTSSLPLKLIYQFFFLIFALTPLVLLAMAYVWVKKIWKGGGNDFLVYILSLFLLVYYWALIVEGLPATVRYSIVLYPLAGVIASFGIYDLFSLKRLKNIPKVWITLGILAISFFSLWQSKPFYFNYANDMLPKKYALSYAWGYGGYEAAQFLNSLPDAQNIVVWSDYYGFRNFFRGTTYDNLIPGKDWKKIDYYVLTQKGKNMYDYWCKRAKNSCGSRYVPAGKYYVSGNPVWELNIDGRPGNFVKIFKSED